MAKKNGVRIATSQLRLLDGRTDGNTMHSRARTIAGLLAVAGTVCSVAPELALAQVSTPQQQVGLDRMQAAPLDHANTFDYVRASVAARDFEAAIAALERLLVYNPGLSRVKYELGVLYFRMASYAMALHYFEDAAQDRDLDPALRRRIEAYLPETRKQLAQHRLSGTVMTGLRYNSNVAGGTDSGQIQSFGLTVPAQGAFRPMAGASAVAMADITHIYDFRTARPLTWESNIAGYAAVQFRQSDLSTGFFDLSSGPRFAVSDDPLSQVTLHPYAVGGASMIGGNPYASSIGGGVSLNAPVTPFISLTPSLEWRGVTANTLVPFGNLGTLNSGSLTTAAVSSQWQVLDGLVLDSRVMFSRNQADAVGASNDQWGLGASLKYDFAPPTDLIGVNWSVTAFARYTSVRFDDANPAVDPTVARRDRQTRVGVQFDAPLDHRLGLGVVVQDTINDSNLANFRSNSWSVMVGPALRF